VEVLEAPGPLAAPLVWSRRTPLAREREGPAPAFPRYERAPTITFEDVHFNYGAGRAPALDGFSLVLPGGETVALVGATGAGKTTAGHLLLRFLEPGGGALRVDGRPLGALSPEEWRRRVAWVPQRPRLFHGTVRENVLLARPGATDGELGRAAGRAHLDAVLAKLERGWETPVGEGGERLSGGEAQRVALARAFLKDAPVLVMDEPTAQLDAASEAAVVGAIEGLRAGRTVLLIGHRLSTVSRADRIAVVSRGKVVEEGTHAELVAAGRGYAQLHAAWEAKV